MPDQQRGRGGRAQGGSRAVVAQGTGGEAAGEGAAAQRALVAVTKEIDNRMAIVQHSAAAGITADRLKLVALTAFTRTPGLWSCDPVSVARAIVEAGQLGLEPTGLMGGAYLVPRGGKATLLVGYRGLVMLAKRSGEVQRAEARVVRERDEFDYGYGLEPWLTHKPSRDADPGEYVAAYAVLFYRDGSKQFDVMTKAEIEDIRKRSSSPNSGPWVTDTAEMWKKTPLRRLMKMAPLTVQVAAKLDELDPEVADRPAAGSSDGAQAKLRQQLQQALEHEYGDQAPQGDQGATTEGEFHEAEASTTQAAGAGTADSQPAAGVEGGDAPPPRAPAAAQQAAGDEHGSSSPAPAGKPERVSATLGATCGATHQGLGVGPCVLPAGHESSTWRDANGAEHPPQGEHEEAGGTHWTQPRANR